MLKFLVTATRIAGLTYQLAATSILITMLGVSVVRHVKRTQKRKLRLIE
jgi:1-aminocyclopropane-1-carboxylate deaminase/D-cysteine desulfhydrase-like pyridoxal-dependent ACC family enzyme